MAEALPLIITRSLDQRTYPGAGDVDDCVPVATIMAYSAEPDHKPLPNVPTFRKAAGVPDRPGATPMTVTQAGVGAHKLWPELRTVAARFSWANFAHAMEVGRRPAMVTVLSGQLPAGLQFGFTGGHAVTVFFQDAEWWIVNPLQPKGTGPHRIDGHDLHLAAGALAGGGDVDALVFPRIPEPVPTVAELTALVATLRAQLAAAEAKLAAAKAAVGQAAVALA